MIRGYCTRWIHTKSLPSIAERLCAKKKDQLAKSVDQSRSNHKMMTRSAFLDLEIRDKASQRESLSKRKIMTITWTMTRKRKNMTKSYYHPIHITNNLHTRSRAMYSHQNTPRTLTKLHQYQDLRHRSHRVYLDILSHQIVVLLAVATWRTFKSSMLKLRFKVHQNNQKFILVTMKQRFSKSTTMHSLSKYLFKLKRV